MRRRDLIKAIAGSTLSWPLAAVAQIAKVRQIGLLSPFTRSDAAPWNQAFLKGLRDLGWIDGKNIAFEYRYSEGNNDRLPALIADLVRLKVDIIVTSVTNDTLAAKNATTEIPIVMAAAGDPVATGIVDSLGRPGGNITGLSQMNPELNAKRLGGTQGNRSRHLVHGRSLESGGSNFGARMGRSPAGGEGTWSRGPINRDPQHRRFGKKSYRNRCGAF